MFLKITQQLRVEHGKIVIKIDPSNLEYFLPSES